MWNTVLEFFKNDSFKFEAEEEKRNIIIFVSGTGGTWMGLARVLEEDNQFIFYSVVPNRTPKEAKPAVMEFITRANYSLLIGNFEMDPEDGEVRFKTGIDVSGDELTTALIKNVVYFNLIAMDKYVESLNRVMFGGIPAKAAFEEAVKKLKG